MKLHEWASNDKSMLEFLRAHKRYEKPKIIVLKIVQQNAFHAEIAVVQSQRPSPAKSPLQGYSLFLDGEGILRMTGTLQESDLPFAQKHRVVLPKQDPYSESIIRNCHLDVLHGGMRDTLVQVREKYWIVRARQADKKIIRSCVVCQRYNAQASRQTPAPLPASRVSQSEPFTVTGLDFAGSLIVRTIRSTRQIYFVIFVCATTRAVHLEVVQDMATPTFLLAFRRFVARRGIPSKVYSDNAYTFPKSNKELKKLWKTITADGVEEKITDWAIDWRYNVPYAPWWGGFYERLIRSVKVALKKTIGARCLNETELTTIVTEIEAVINSRPLTFVYDDQEIRPLFPAAFLTGKRLTILPASNTGDMPESSADTIQRCWRQRAESLRTVWGKWSREYLTELRNLWSKRRGRALQEGDLVIVREDCRPRQRWTTGRISRCLPGRDQKSRAFEVKLPNGSTIVRCDELLYKLEV
ncbi:uncharacterized protein LOC135371684 [Ornithodoros turicata]|uniref:uncharacterized protein LOC135371684 n=1 Tax=Ornithodoros turicata TaxID=34597 RepID=UPI00313A2FC0